ncbi:MAG: FG-GAP-like repeat-containing protein, partial [Dehalococcoidales bacterium]|nr:FG-GAP-like repeat-containing protein [Dehalococcoidales bacterium]
VAAYAGNRLTVIDVSNPAAPVLAGSLLDNINLNYPLSVYVSGKYAYVAAANGNRLTILDISGIDSPAANIGNLESGNITVTENLNVGNNIYARNGINAGPGGIYSGGSLAAYTSSTGTGTAALTVSQAGTGRIVNFLDNSTSVFNIADGGNITFTGSIINDVKPSTNITYNLGSVAMDTTADVTMTGGATGDQLGQGTASAGDVNGDGYNDVIVGAPNVHGAGTDRGQAYIYYGGSTMDNTADITFTGVADNDYFGHRVSSAGDVNGDGYSDVIIGAYGYLSATGRAYIYYGGSSMDNVADITLTGEAVTDFFGYRVSSAGDVNGDGYGDVIVGAYSYSTYTGRAYIYYGGPSMDNVADITLTGEAIGDYFGIGVSSAGDVNGDGYGDVIVGAQSYSSGTGRAYIYYGGPSMDNVADITLTGGATSNYFGVSVSSAGDINGDGYGDVIVGAEGYSSFTGRAYIYYGGSAMDTIADETLTGGAINNSFGLSVSSVGDINGDGYGDVIVGAYGYSTYTGRAYIYYGGSAMDTTIDVTFTGGATINYFGASVSSAGDINGDGYSDVIVGASYYSSSTGRAYIYQGSGYRWKSLFGQEANFSRGLQIGGLAMDRWGLNTDTMFGITAPNWSIDKQGTASFQDAIIAGNLGIGTTAPSSKLDILQNSAQAALTVNQSGTGNIIDLKYSSTSLFTLANEDRLKLEATLATSIGTLNDTLIDDMEDIADWTASSVNTPVASETAKVKVNDAAMKITTGASSTTADYARKTISSEDWSAPTRIGFWIQATQTGQIISLQFYDDGGTTSDYNITVKEANIWQYEEWDISAITGTSRDAITWVQFLVDSVTDTPAFYIDQLRLYTVNRNAEFFIDTDGYLSNFSGKGFEFTRPAPGGGVLP